MKKGTVPFPKTSVGRIGKRNRSFFRVLITSGPTSVPIDEMRVITNRSTGEIGRLLSQAFVAQKTRVTLLEGAVTTGVVLPKGVLQKKFYFFSELEKLLKAELRKKPDIVIHAAAVSDFSLSKTYKGKLSSSDKVKLELVPTRKLVNGIKKGHRRPFLVGFKFEPKLDRKYILQKVEPLFAKAHCNLVIANTQKGDKYGACLIVPDGGMTRQVSSKKELVKLLMLIMGYKR